jgi:hypothetical protein
MEPFPFLEDGKRSHVPPGKGDLAHFGDEINNL